METTHETRKGDTPMHDTRKTQGGQPGNRNARKSRPCFYDPEDADLMEMSYTLVLDGLDKSIAVARVKIHTLLAGSPEDYDLMYAATGTLAELIRYKDRVIRNLNRIRSGKKV